MKPEFSIMPAREKVETVKRKPLTRWELATLYLEQNGRCKKCRSKIYKGYCDDDHVEPLACGGTNDTSNRQLLCPPCHSEKTNKKDKGATAEIKRRQGVKGQRARRAKRSYKSKYKRKVCGKTVLREKQQ